MHSHTRFRFLRCPVEATLLALVVLLGGCGGDSTTAPSGPSPKPPAGALHFVDLTAGLEVNCGLVASGAAYCWGDGTFGELGIGIWDSIGGTSQIAVRSRPVAVLGGHSFTSITAGSEDTCGIATNGAAYCWGENSYGSLGDGTTPAAGAVATIPTAVAGGFLFVELSSGSMQTCGLTKSRDPVCWGLIETGMPVIVPAFAGINLKHMNTGGNSAGGPCFLSTSGAAYCGILADTVATSHPWSSFTVGWAYACALTPDGHAYCWGSNDQGQLSNDSTTETCAGHACSSAPLAMTGGLTFLSVSAGHHHSCGVTTAHDVYCWGGGFYGELGDGNRTTRGVVPRKVAGGLSFATVSAGYISTCGLTTDGFAYCWGEGGFGGLGNGSLDNALTPVPVASP